MTDIEVALDLMDAHWPGYQNAKKIIRDHIAELESLERSCIDERLKNAQERIKELLDERSKSLDVIQYWKDKYSSIAAQEPRCYPHQGREPEECQACALNVLQSEVKRLAMALKAARERIEALTEAAVELRKAAVLWRQFGPEITHDYKKCGCEKEVDFIDPSCGSFQDFEKAIAATAFLEEK